VALLTRISQREQKFGGGGGGGQEKFGWQGAGPFALRQERARRHCLWCSGQVGVWPIYRATLLVSAVRITYVAMVDLNGFLIEPAEARKAFKRACRFQVRDNVSITIQDWRLMPEATKEQLW
jgi:hypothetical protein